MLPKKVFLYRVSVPGLLASLLLLILGTAVAQSPTPAVLLSPGNQVSGLQNPVTFMWTQVSGANAYYLYVGTSPGTNNIVDTGEIQTTQLTRVLISGTFYARVYTLINAHWYASSDVTFSVAAPPTPAQLIAPTNSATLNGSSPVTLSWTSVPNASVYYLYVGTAPGANNVVNSGEIKVTQLSRLLQPGKYYARIYSQIGQAWYASADVSFSVTNASALAFPDNGATDVDPYINFAWPSFPGATAYSLSVGTSPGASDTLATTQTTETSYQVSSPLQHNTAYYAQLGTFQGGNWFYTNSSFTTGTGIAHLLSPANGATNIDVFSKLSWTAVADAQAYYVYVGSSQGLKDVYDSGEMATTSLAVPTFAPNKQYFIRLHTEKNSRWYSLDYSFTTGSGIAQMVYPADKAMNVDPALPFQWSSDPRALAYFISIGTSPGLSDIYNSGETLDTNRLISVPGSGTYYIRLSTKRPEGWKSVDSSFTLGDFVAHLTTPANQALANIDAMFTWTTAADADAYYLTVGTTLGARDAYDSGELNRNNTFVPNLVPGTTYFARLFTHRLGVWRYSDSTFLAGQGTAVLNDPQDGTIISPFNTFSWSIPEFPGDAYYLTIGTTPGARDIFDSGVLQGTSIKPFGLDFGKTYYATLYTLKDNVWHAVQSTFSTFEQSSMPDLAVLRSGFYAQVQQTTASVRLMADPSTNQPLPGTPLAAELQHDGLETATCSQYALVLQSQLRSLGIRTRIRNMTLTGTSTESHTTLEYYDPFLQQWSIADATFGIVYFDPATQIGQSVEAIQALVLANDFAHIHVTTTTNYGDNILRAYYVDPVTLYTNVTPPDQTQPTLGPQPNSPLQYLLEVPLQGVGTGGTYILSFQDPSEQAAITLPSGASIFVSAQDGTIFSSARVLPNGWSLSSAPSDLKLYTPIRPLF